MGANVGRTTGKFVRFIVDYSNGTLAEIPVTSINGVGLTYDEAEGVALQDALKTALPAMPDCQITITGPFDSSAIVAIAASGAAPALSGSHTVLNAIVGKQTPLTLGILIGMRQYWTSGEPVFGLQDSTTNGFVCTDYTMNPTDMTYTAKFRLFAGSAIPAWGTAIFT